jgi:hypothetical protein
MSRTYTVRAEWDWKAGVWVVGESDIPGLFIEAPTFDAFVEVVQDVAPALLDDDTRASAKVVICAETTIEFGFRRQCS